MELIYDFETLGVRKLANVTALDVSAFAFDPARFVTDPYTFEEIVADSLRIKFDVADQIRNYKTGRDQSTYEFWISLPVEDQKRTLRPSNEDLTLVTAIDKLLTYIESNKITRWWSRSNTFDPVILEGQCEKLDLFDRFRQALPYNKVRDTRSFIEGYFGLGDDVDNGFLPVANSGETAAFEAKFRKHDSQHDIAADLLRLQLIERDRAGF